MTTLFLTRIQSLVVSNLQIIRDASLQLLLDDQITKDDENFGSWGKTTLDYCFLTTTLPQWSPGLGSITQTVWALLGLKSWIEANVNDRERVRVAARRAEQFVSTYINLYPHDSPRD